MLGKKAFCQILKRLFIGWITGQNVQRLQIFAIWASFRLWGNLNLFLKPTFFGVFKKYYESKCKWKMLNLCLVCFYQQWTWKRLIHLKNTKHLWVCFPFQAKNASIRHIKVFIICRRIWVFIQAKDDGHLIN